MAAVAAASLWHRRHELASLAAVDVSQLAAQAWHICLMTCLEMAAALAVLAVLDYGVQRWQLERRLSMTPQELREEMRELQGDPQIAARRRGLRQARASSTSQPPAGSAGSSATANSRPAPGTSPVNVGGIDAIR